MEMQRQRRKPVFSVVHLSPWTVTNIQPLSSANEATLEHQVKSDYPDNFSKFVRGPEAEPDSAHNVFTVCVIGPAEMRVSLYRLRIKQADGRNLEISFRDTISGLAVCQIASIAADSHAKCSSALPWCRHNHVLACGDQPDFTQLGSVMVLKSAEDRVQLVMSRPAAPCSRLQIGAKLLELKRAVNQRSPEHV